MKLLTAANRAIRDAPWLGPEHAALVEALRAMARELDANGTTAAGVSQYRQLAQAIIDARPSDHGDPEPDADLHVLR